MTATQTSRLSFLKFVVLGSFLVPLLAVSGGAAVAGDEPVPTPMLDAPPSFILAVMGVGLVSLAVGRRVLKTARS